LHLLLFLLTAIATPSSSTLSLHDALPIFVDQPFALQLNLLLKFAQHIEGLVARGDQADDQVLADSHAITDPADHAGKDRGHDRKDRKSTRLNSSHLGISYAVFCLKKKKKT